MKHLSLLAICGIAAVSAPALTSISFADDHNTQAASETAEHKAVYTEVDATALQELINNGGALILDARSDDEFAEGRIPGAIQLRPDNATPEKLAELAPQKDTVMVFYCGSVQCPASAKAAHKAAEAGYTKLYKYPGGMADWNEQGLPVEQG